MRGMTPSKADPLFLHQYTDEEVAFLKAMDAYKRTRRRPFPTWREVLRVIHSLGYRKVEAETELPKYKED